MAKENRLHSCLTHRYLVAALNPLVSNFFWLTLSFVSANHSLAHFHYLKIGYHLYL